MTWKSVNIKQAGPIDGLKTMFQTGPIVRPEDIGEQKRDARGRRYRRTTGDCLARGYCSPGRGGVSWGNEEKVTRADGVVETIGGSSCAECGRFHPAIKSDDGRHIHSHPFGSAVSDDAMKRLQRTPSTLTFTLKNQQHFFPGKNPIVTPASFDPASKGSGAGTSQI